MTYREHIEGLRKKVIESLTKYHKSENELALEGGGFIDKKFFDDAGQAYSEWQISQNEFNNTLSFVVRNGLNLDDEMSSNT